MIEATLIRGWGPLFSNLAPECCFRLDASVVCTHRDERLICIEHLILNGGNP